MEKLVSIILPTYNGASHIANAIDSVIAQTYTHWELLIIDDGSVDTTMDVVSKFTTQDRRIRYIKNEKNLGIQKTLNRGLREARGEYIARIDDDDYWSDAEKITTQIDFLEQNPEYVLVGTGAILVDESGKEFGRYILPDSDTHIRNRLLGKNCFVHPSVVFRTEVAREVGGYSEHGNVRHVEDYEFWLRLGLIGKMTNLSTYSITLMVHPKSITARYRILQAKRIIGLSWKYRKEYPHVIKNSILATGRYVFFCIQKIIPIPASVVYKLQSLQRSI